MTSFTYKAIDGSGEVVKGLVEENHIDQAYDSVSSLGLHILSIKNSGNLSNIYAKNASGWGIKRKDIIEFATNLAVMLRAGLPVAESMTDIAETLENRRFRSRLLEITRAVELGSTLSHAIAGQKDIFPEIFVNLVSVGEETGRLDESLSDIAVHLQRMEDLKSAIIRAVMYPAFALAGTSGALLFWLVYVLPKMAEVFVSMGVKLPLTTELLMTASDISRSYWYVYFLVPFLIYIMVKLMSRKERTKYHIDILKLKLPVLKLIIHNKLLALFAEQLRILFAAGITIDRSLEIMIKVADNIPFKKALVQMKDDILLGSKMSDALKRHGQLFPILSARMISVGESTGNLGEQLNYLSEYYLKKLDDIADKMNKLLEPLVIIVVGSIFMIIILGLLAPIYDLMGGIGQ